MTLTQRDIEIICFVYRMDGCVTETLRERFWPSSVRTTVHARLARLVEAKYMTTLRLPPITNRGSGPSWYTIGSASLPLLTQTLGLSPTERKQLRHATLPTAFRHEVDSRTARLRLELAIERAGVVTLEEWQTERALRRQAIRVHDALSRDVLELTPDGALTLATADGRICHLLYELDRGTLVSSQRMVPRLRAHLQYSEARAVLIVVPDAVRAAQVSRWAMQAARQLDVSPDLFWLAEFDQITAETALTHPIWTIVGRGRAALLSALLPTPAAQRIEPDQPLHDEMNLQ
jgi:hypothetical protein